MERDGYLGDSGEHLSRTDLDARPTLDEVKPEYEELMAEVLAVVTTVLPEAEVIEPYSGGQGGCSIEVGDVELVDITARYYFPKKGIQARPTDEQWQQIREQIAPILEEHHFESTAMDIEINTTKNLAVGDRYGATLSLGYNKAIALSLTSGCHLTER